jgi:hypothetical protein
MTRLVMFNPLATYLGRTFVKRFRITFSSPDNDVVIVCAVSKNHNDPEWPAYWFGFAFQPHHKETLEKAKEAYLAYELRFARFDFSNSVFGFRGLASGDECYRKRWSEVLACPYLQGGGRTCLSKKVGNTAHKSRKIYPTE